MKVRKAQSQQSGGWATENTLTLTGTGQDLTRVGATRGMMTKTAMAVNGAHDRRRPEEGRSLVSVKRAVRR